MQSWNTKNDSLQVAHDENVVIITLNRPKSLNALTTELRAELASTIRYFGNPRYSEGIILTGRGRAFSSGQDLKSMSTTEREVLAGIESFNDITRAVLETQVPTVAAVNGLAVGGACEMTLCFDSRIGTDAAEFYLPENSRGLVISNGTSYLLQRLVGPPEAARFLLGSKRIDAKRAQAIGLLDDIVDEGELLREAKGLIKTWNTVGSSTMAHLKLLRPNPDTVEKAMGRETTVAVNVWKTGLTSKGVKAFWENRQSPDE